MRFATGLAGSVTERADGEAKGTVEFSGAVGSFLVTESRLFAFPRFPTPGRDSPKRVLQSVHAPASLPFLPRAAFLATFGEVLPFLLAVLFAIMAVPIRKTIAYKVRTTDYTKLHGQSSMYMNQLLTCCRVLYLFSPPLSATSPRSTASVATTV